MHGPLTDATYRGIRWSTEGQQVALVVAPPQSVASPAGVYGLYVRDLDGAEATLLYQFEADDDLSIEWSPSGEWLLVGAVGIGPSVEEETQSFIGAFLVTLPTQRGRGVGH